MKKISVFTLAILAIFAVGALAAGYLPRAVNKQDQIQNLKGISPEAGKSRCDTVTGTKAVQRSYSTAGYIGIEAAAYNSATGAPENVKWEEDGKQVWSGSTYAATNNKGAVFTKVTYKAYSATSRTVGTCIRRQ